MKNFKLMTIILVAKPIIYGKTISKAKIEAKEEGVIQSKEDKSDRKSWRRVILEVKGETSVPNTDKEIVYNTSLDEINADK